MYSIIVSDTMFNCIHSPFRLHIDKPSLKRGFMSHCHFRPWTTKGRCSSLVHIFTKYLPVRAVVIAVLCYTICVHFLRLHCLFCANKWRWRWF